MLLTDVKLVKGPSINSTPPRFAGRPFLPQAENKVKKIRWENGVHPLLVIDEMLI